MFYTTKLLFGANTTYLDSKTSKSGQQLLGSHLLSDQAAAQDTLPGAARFEAQPFCPGRRTHSHTANTGIIRILGSSLLPAPTDEHPGLLFPAAPRSLCEESLGSRCFPTEMPMLCFPAPRRLTGWQRAGELHSCLLRFPPAIHFQRTCASGFRTLQGLLIHTREVDCTHRCSSKVAHPSALWMAPALLPMDMATASSWSRSLFSFPHLHVCDCSPGSLGSLQGWVSPRPSAAGGRTGHRPHRPGSQGCRPPPARGHSSGRKPRSWLIFDNKRWAAAIPAAGVRSLPLWPERSAAEGTQSARPVAAPARPRMPPAPPPAQLRHVRGPGPPVA